MRFPQIVSKPSQITREVRKAILQLKGNFYFILGLFRVNWWKCHLSSMYKRGNRYCSTSLRIFILEKWRIKYYDKIYICIKKKLF